jgi:hypothetical protein
MINAKLQNLYNIKNDIGTAIVNKGGTITESTPFYSYAGEIDNISTGTPQTVFQDSTGAKWARTNVVNLTNVSNNVTSDFNWWQPANNTTSDAILNVGTVGANISGNIRLVPVNQVNIAQYVNFVATDTTGAKYEGFNGYDFFNNPTPTGNTTFNRWLLNNSATGTIIFANVTMTTGNYAGPNSTINQASLTQRYSFSTGSFFTGVSENEYAFNDGNYYHRTSSTLHKIRDTGTSFSYISNGSVDGGITTLKVNNGFIIAGRSGAVLKYHESNFANTGQSGTTRSFTTSRSSLVKNNLVFIGEDQIHIFHESNLSKIGNTPFFENSVGYMDRVNNNLYASSLGRGFVHKYAFNSYTLTTNLVIGGGIFGIKTDSNFVYVLNSTQIRKYHESNLTLAANSANITVSGPSRGSGLNIANGFIFMSYNASGFGFKKFHASNLVEVGGTTAVGQSFIEPQIYGNTVVLFNSSQVLSSWNTSSASPSNQTFYTATKIKE